MRFRTKVDWWVGAAIALALLLGPIAVFATREWAWLAMVIVSDVVIVLVCWPCDYTLGEKGLLIRSGVVRWKVPYELIDRVYPTRSPIYYHGFPVMVSPEDHRVFVTKLGQLAGLSQRGLELFREDKPGH